jgi:hypothetical protein
MRGIDWSERGFPHPDVEGRASLIVSQVIPSAHDKRNLR